MALKTELVRCNWKWTNEKLPSSLLTRKNTCFGKDIAEVDHLFLWRRHQKGSARRVEGDEFYLAWNATNKFYKSPPCCQVNTES